MNTPHQGLTQPILTSESPFSIAFTTCGYIPLIPTSLRTLSTAITLTGQNYVKKHNISASSQKGVGLIEVLVSLLVLSIGLLGLAAMQATGLKQSRQAFYHTQATVLTYDLIDRMRANDAAAENGHYAVAYGTFTATACASSCSAGQIADNDKLEWKASLTAQLPSGDGSVVDRNNGRFDISIRWTDGDGLSDPLTIGIQL